MSALNVAHTECKYTADKYLEYERNLKILSIILCFSNIYRHIFFNHDLRISALKEENKSSQQNAKEDQLKQQQKEEFENGNQLLKIFCIFFSVILFVMLYWHEVRNHYLNQEDFQVDYFSPQVGRKNIQLVYTFNPSIIFKVLLNNFSYLSSLVLMTYAFKRVQFMRRNQQKTNQQKFQLFIRVFYVILLSHVGYLGIFMEIIWNYNPVFFTVLDWYNIYSNFICISAILNNRLEKFIAITIIYISIIISHALSSILIGNSVPLENHSNTLIF
ncbi:UNKNOWN [Stylonychia lemnae]|uniref:Protein ARV n=1 Tax=Stylonychia lemnae TaxID=5949 RepID=A0A078AN27_STYLE|nr:UNKNOWN [Stylonychia lemnae]|eukprot:CDW83564.1 UNKNOWN [Stylonychia lemnae]